MTHIVDDAWPYGAIAVRLGKLRNMPVDTTRLERVLRAQLPPLNQKTMPRRWAPVAALAASLLVMAAIVLPMLQSREVQASPVMMATLYHDVVEGRVPTIGAKSLAQANNAIAAFAGAFPMIPESPAARMMACCMRNIGNRTVACVLLDHGGTPLTMVVANAADIESPSSPAIVYDGVTYHVQSSGNLQMVMTERDKRWVCLIGPLAQDRLIEIARGIRF